MGELDKLVEVIMGKINEQDNLDLRSYNEFRMGVEIGKKQSLLSMLDIIGDAQTRQKDKLKLSNTTPTNIIHIYEPGDMVEIVRDTGIEFCIGETVTVIANDSNYIKVRSIDGIELDLLTSYIKLSK